MSYRIRVILVALLILQLYPGWIGRHSAQDQQVPLFSENFHYQSTLPAGRIGSADTNFIAGLLKSADSLFQADRLKESEKLLSLVIKNSGTPADKKYYLQAMYLLGIIKDKQGYRQQGIHILKNTFVFTGKKDSLLRIKILNSIIYAYIKQNSFDTAAFYAYKAVSMLAEHNMLWCKDAIPVWANLSGVWYEMSDHPKSLYYLERAAHIIRAHKDSFGLSKILINQGVIYEEINTDSSVYYYLAAKNIIEKGINPKSYANLMNNLALIYLKRKEFLKAHENFLIAKEAAQKSKDSHLLVHIYYGLGEAYMGLKRNNDAENSYLISIGILKKIQIKRFQCNPYKALSELYALQKKHELAHKLLQESNAYENLLAKHKILDNINNYEIKYQSERKDKELALHQLTIIKKEAELQQKNIWFYTLLLGSLLTILFLILLYKNNKNKLKLRIARLETTEQQQKIEYLQALMRGEENERKRIARELHDGIASILGAARMHLHVFKNDQHNVNDKSYLNGLNLLDEASKQLRDTAHNLLPEPLLEKGLIPTLHEYCKRISNPPAFNVIFQTLGEAPQLDAGKALSIYRIIQELVHNALKHAQANEVIIEIFNEDHNITVNVEDNGLGMNLNDMIHKGQGIESLKQRIKAMNGTMEIDSRPGNGTTFHIIFTKDN